MNDKVANVADGLLSLEVEECYLHCAKAFRRSNFWAPRSLEQSIHEVLEFIQQVQFLALASINSSGQAG